MQLLLAHLIQAPKMSLVWDDTADIVGMHNACVIGVDLARGVTILVVPGRVFA